MRKPPPHVELKPDQRGNPRLYFRIGKGKRTRLPLDIDSPEFAAAYHAAYIKYHSDGEQESKTDGRTIEALISAYIRHDTYRNLRPTTKAGYSSRIETLRTQHGHRICSLIVARLS
jgi:enterobacteria phage integrase